MPTDQMARVIPHLRRAALLRDGGGMTDERLLECFIADRDEAAFEALVRRHGPMVLGVCRRMVGNLQDAEDAFQATFLVLVRKAASVAPREAVGNWLYGVAYRTALEARTRNARRRARETPIKDVFMATAEPEPIWQELRPILDQELSRLPDKYRLPVVLCELEGRGRKEVSDQLRLPEGTLSSRLARGRRMLAGRLARRGLALSAGTLALVLAHNAASACAPAPLVVSTVKAATLVAAGQAAAGVLSAPVAALMEGVLRAMLATQFKSAMIVVLIIALFGTGAGVLTHAALAGPAATPQRMAAFSQGNLAASADERGGDNAGRPPGPGVAGKVIAVGADGKSVTVEINPGGRGQEPQKADVKLTDKTEVTYFNVGTAGAKLTEGYNVQVWLAAGSKDTADKVRLEGAEGRRAPDVSGRVANVSNDGKAVTIQIEARGIEARGAEKTTAVHIADKTNLLYSFIAMGGAKPTVDYNADVWFENGSHDTAARVSFCGGQFAGERGVLEKAPDAVGSVVAMSKDGKAFTMDAPAAARGDPPVKQEIKIDDKTQFVYFNVGPDGDRPTQGDEARVWFADGSKDTAAKVVLRGVPKEPPVVRGKIFTVSKDDKTITLELPPVNRVDPPRNMDIHLSDKTLVVYEGVGPDGARLTAGYIVEVRLEEGSKDAAVQVVLTPDQGGRR